MPFPGGLRGEGESLMGSRALTHWTLVLIQSVRGPLAYHYQTLSLRLNRTVISCQSWKMIRTTHTHTSCSPFVWIVLPQLVPVCMHRFENWCFEELMLKTGTCCYEVGATAVQALLFSCIVTDQVDTNYPYFQSTN